MTTVADPAALLDMVGTDLGTTDWVEVTQLQTDQFAEATGDHTGSTSDDSVAQSYLTLAIVNLFLPDLLTVESFSMGVNVGLDEVRFAAPVPVGSRVRARGAVVAADEVKCGVPVTVRVTIDRDLTGDGTADSTPTCVADTVSRFFP